MGRVAMARPILIAAMFKVLHKGGILNVAANRPQHGKREVIL